MASRVSPLAQNRPAARSASLFATRHVASGVMLRIAFLAVAAGVLVGLPQVAERVQTKSPNLVVAFHDAR